MRIRRSACLLVAPVTLCLVHTGCERPTGFCQTNTDCGAALVCSSVSRTCEPALTDMASAPGTQRLGTVLQTPSGSLAGDFFAYAIAATSSFVVLGAYAAQGSRGAAYVADINAKTSGPPIPLPSIDTPTAGDAFGYAVAASGNTLAVSAYNKDIAKGAVYVYTRTGAVFGAPAKLALPTTDALSGDYFGISVGLSGDVLVVGAHNKDGAKGAAYVSVRTPAGTGTWGPLFRLTAPTDVPLAALDYFGLTVAASQNFVAVGAPGRNQNKGAVYVHKADPAMPGRWLPLFSVAGTQPGEQLGGNGLALSLTTLAVGSPFYTDQAQFQGAVYLYDVSQTAPTLTLTATNPRPRQRLGFSVALAPTEGAATTLISGAPGREQALLFRRNTGQPWMQTSALDVSPEANRASFGAAVATNGMQHVVGIRGLVQDIGAAYFFSDN